MNEKINTKPLLVDASRVISPVFFFSQLVKRTDGLILPSVALVAKLIE